MDQQEQHSNNMLNDNKFGESSKSPPSSNSTYLNFNILDTNDSVFKHNSLNRDVCDPGKYLDLQRMLIDQGNAVMALKMSEYEKCLAEKDSAIKSLHTDMMNSQNNNHVLTNKCKNIVEKTKSVSQTCLRLNESFTNICDRLNKLSDTVDNARTRQNDVKNLVDQATNTFQEKILNISDNIDDSLKQANIEKMRAKQEIEILENKYFLETSTYKSNLEKCTKENESLKIENSMILEKLNEEKQMHEEQIISLNQHHEQVLKEMENQNISKNKSLNVKYEEIINENQFLKDENSTIKISLDEQKKQIDNLQIVIKEQTVSVNNLKIAEELNDALKKDNLSLKERYEYLEKNYANLMEDMNKIKLSHEGIQEENEIKIKDIYKHFDNLLKIQEDKLIEKTEQSQLQYEKQCKIEAEMIDLKQALDESNNTIFNLQEELKTNYVIIPELQNKIDDLSTNLANAYQELQGNLPDQDNIIEINKLKKEKSELEIQNKEHFKQIEKLTVNYLKYKSKAKQLYVEVMRLRFKCPPLEQKNTFKKCSTLNTIEILSDEDINMDDDDCSIVEFNINDITNQNVQSTSNVMKRNLSPLRQMNNSTVKKCMTSNDITRVSTTPTKHLKQKVEKSLSSSFKNINFEHEDKNINDFEDDFNNIELNTKDVLNMDVSLQSTSNIKKRNSSPLKQINNSKVKKRKTSIDNISSRVNKENNQNLLLKESKTTANEIYDVNNVNNDSKNKVTKKLFKIPADIRPIQKKSKPATIQNVDWSKPNSPVILIPAPKQSPQSK